MKTPKILALPYENSAVGIIYGRPKNNGESTFIADCQIEQANDRQTQAELARIDFIVKACNNHHALLDALEKCISAMNATSENFPQNTAYIRALDNAFFVAGVAKAA